MLVVVTAALWTVALASNPWDKYNLSPKHRTLLPVRIHSSTADCTGGVVNEWGGGGSGSQPTPQLDFQCADGGRFKAVEFVSFGNPTGSCAKFERGTCDAGGAKEIVEKLCVGKSRCVLPSESSVINGSSPLVRMFGDPCPGTVKRFALRLSGCTSHSSASMGQGASLFPVSLHGSGASVVFDFGKEVGGFTTISLGEVSAGASAQLAWSESTYYISTGDNSNGGSTDGPLATGALSSGMQWVTPAAKLRGGFRYLNVFLTDASSITIKNISLHFTAAPTFESPSAYANHFFSDDNLVNRVWYGAAYTVQLSSIDPKQGRTWPAPKSGWDNSAVCGVGRSVLVDGAKRDRVVWPGDMGISTATAYYTTGDVESSTNSLDTLYPMQEAGGMLPYAGPPVNFYGNSDMYHLWTLVGTVNVFHYTGNTTWLRLRWDGFKRAVACSCGKISKRGLMSVDKKADWQRGGQGGENLAANSVLAHILEDGYALAVAMSDTPLGLKWRSMATSLKSAIHTHLWDEEKGAHKDNPSSSIHPQDGNSLAVWFNVTTQTQARRISDYLHSNWGTYGSGSPEWGMNIGTFPGSMEVNAHAAAGNTKRALDMVRLQWGYMLNNPNSTESTFWEGYNSDGTFNFQGIYMSNAHGWATGAASMLSVYVLGLRPVSPGGDRYAVAPDPGDLQHCRGRLTFAAGRFVDVAWSRNGLAEDGINQNDGTSLSLALNVDARQHPGSVGEIAVPVHVLAGKGAKEVSIVVDGRMLWSSVGGNVLSRPLEHSGGGSVRSIGMSIDRRYVHFVMHGGAQTQFDVKRVSEALVV